jgi:hypothetical protein
MFPLEQARIAIQQGNREKARAILANLVKTEPLNSNAWLLLAEVLDNPQQASYCRERAQSILKNQAQQNTVSNKVEITPAKSINDGSKKIQAKCPFCAELIPSDAIVCPYCGRNLSNQAAQVMISPQRLQPKPITSNSVNKQSSYGANIVLAIIVGIVLICGFILLSGTIEGASTPKRVFLKSICVSSQYFGVTIFEPRQIWEEKPFLRLSWRIWHSRFVATPFF